MKIIPTADLGPNRTMNPDDTSWVYNGLDCCLTYEIRNRLRENLALEPDNVKETYATALRKMPPVLYMNAEGIKIDGQNLQSSIAEYDKLSLIHI